MKPFVLVLVSMFLAPLWGGEAVKNRAPLERSAFYPLPLTSVKPAGWLKDQLRIQAEGITGQLGDFWPDVGPNSAWLGGTGEGWERGPYYLDGLLPLAYLLDDPKLIAKVKPWVEWTLSHQRADGGIGPASNKDWWPNMIMLKVLTQYQEATGDARVIPFMEKYMAHHAANMQTMPLKQWAVYRWQDQLLSVIWLYNRTGDERLLKFVHALKAQGFDWRRHFEEFPYYGKMPRELTTLSTHGVNNAMGLKTTALWSLVSKDPAERASTARQIEVLDRLHGLANGMFSADEHFAGRSPSQGIELCAVVEEMFSLELALGVSGNAPLGDRLEKIAYNALPATQTADQLSHQYDQQPNQVMCSMSRREWGTNGPESNLFGLEPNFGCCTANLHQGWPKFVASLWMASEDGGLAAGAYGPSEVKTKVGGVEVMLREWTEYPFRDTIVVELEPSAAVKFPLHLRIPAWAEGASILVNGTAAGAPKPGEYARIEREWTRGDRVELKLPMRVRTVRGFADSVSVERGPLVYSLKIEESWRKLKQTGPVTDWEVYPASAWNYGLRLVGSAAQFEVLEAPLARQPFVNGAPPVALKAKARRLPQWMLVNDSAAPPPPSPVSLPVKEEATGKWQDETVTLVPYGGARLRITSFPVLAPRAGERLN